MLWLWFDRFREEVSIVDPRLAFNLTREGRRRKALVCSLQELENNFFPDKKMAGFCRLLAARVQM